MIKLLVEQLEDEVIRENFKRVSDFINNATFLKGDFKFFEFIFDAAVTDLLIPHGLRFAPKDVVQTYASNAMTVTWAYDSFTRQHVKLTTSAAGTIRAYIGIYRETNG